MHSFLGDVIKNMTEREEALGESTKFAARVGILQFQTEQLEEMTNNSYSVANGGEVNALRRGRLRQRQFRDGMERSSFLSSGVKFALQVLLRDVEI